MPGSFQHGRSRNRSCSNLQSPTGASSPSRARTPSQLQSSAGALPPIKVKAQPLRFEELYVLAKQRAAKQTARARSAGTTPSSSTNRGVLPELHSAQKKLMFYSTDVSIGGAEEDPVKVAEEVEWAQSALTDIEPEKTGDGPAEAGKVTDGEPVAAGNRSPSLTSSVGSRRSSWGMDGQSTEMQATSGSNADEERKRRLSMSGVPDILEHLANAQDGVTSDSELARLRSAFNRFKVPGSADLHVDDVPDLLDYLGHVITKREKIDPIFKQVTQYDYLDFEEFVDFVGRFNTMEREQFHTVFREFDTDGSGEISVQELRHVTAALGFTPLRKMIMEALSVVDTDSNGQLNFDEFITFLTVYRHAEGFTKEEVGELERSFQHFSVRGPGGVRALPPEGLSNCLVRVFGLQVSKFTQKMANQLASGQGLQKSSLATSDEGEPECLSFPELLIFARKIREEQLRNLRNKFGCWGGHHDNLQVAEMVSEQREFKRHDTDDNGMISEDELKEALVIHGYTPLRNVMEEAFAEVLDGPWTPNRELDFNEFFDFMLVIRQRDGFLRAEVKDMRFIFNRFDSDHSGEISALELSDLFRHMGYNSTLDDMHELVVIEDKNENGQLDFREFLSLMRKLREEELRKAKDIFSKYADSRKTHMPGAKLVTALEKLGNDAEELQALLGPRLAQIEQSRLDFDKLVAEMDTCRSAKVKKLRKKAGFSDAELVKFREVFETFDKDKSGHIDNLELINLLSEFGWQPRSKQAQADLMMKLDIARAGAREAGIQDVGEDGSPCIKFWAFVQLARMLKRETELKSELRMHKLMKQLQFSEQEVEQFRTVFRHWIKREAERAKELGRIEQKKVSEEGLNRDAVRRLLRSLGVSLQSDDSKALSQKLGTLEEGGLLDFGGFLQLMKWVVDTNFANINDASARYT